MSTVIEIVNRCRSYDDELEWFEFKQGTALSKPDDIGEYISALSKPPDAPLSRREREIYQK